MAFAPDGTTRWFLKYEVSGDEHVFQMRSNPAISAGTAGSAMENLLTALDNGSALYTMNIVDFSRSAAGSSDREPQTWPGAASYGGGSMPEVDSPRYFALSGRASGNQQVRVFIYGWIGTSPDNFRIASADNTDVADAVASLSDTAGCWLTAGLGVPIWKPYANIGFNAYFQRKQRVVA